LADLACAGSLFDPFTDAILGKPELDVSITLHRVLTSFVVVVPVERGGGRCSLAGEWSLPAMVVGSEASHRLAMTIVRSRRATSGSSRSGTINAHPGINNCACVAGHTPTIVV